MAPRRSGGRAERRRRIERSESADIDLPDECLIEVFSWLEVNELLSCAWVCRRWLIAAADGALWRQTRFSVTSSDEIIRHFSRQEDRRPYSDHTGYWVPCKRLVDKAAMLCRMVALDYVDRDEGVCYRLLRSISCLQRLHHERIVALQLVNLDVARNQLQLFYEDAGTPLERVLRNGALPMSEAREVLRQVLEALSHCHRQGITHRNLKPKYIMMQRDSQGRLHTKISDFNSVRWLATPQYNGDDGLIYGALQVIGSCSPTVVTQPYRAPEILLGCTNYSTKIDLWAAGCVFAEMLSGSILFAGDSDIGQLFTIFDLLGTPGPDRAATWRGVEALPHYSNLFPKMKPKSLAEHPKTRELCKCPLAEDLLRRMLTFDPKMRVSAAAALRHPFFVDSPRLQVRLSPTSPAQPFMTPERPSLATRSFCGSSSCDGATPAGGSLLARSDGMRSCESERGDGSRCSETTEEVAGRSASPSEAQQGVSRVWEEWRARERQQHCAPYGSRGEGVAAPRRARGARGQFCAAAAHPDGQKGEMRGTAHAFEREEAVLWLLNAATEFCHSDRTVHLAMCVFDAYAAKTRSTSPGLLQAVAALMLACKFQEVEIHMVEEFVYFCGERLAQSEILSAELQLCAVLQFDFAIPTAVDFLYCALQRLDWPNLFSVHRGMHKQAVMLAQYLCDLSLLSPTCAALPASLVASAALCLALACLRCGHWRNGSHGEGKQAEQYWTAGMEQATGYGRSQLRPAVEALQREHVQAYAELAHASGGEARRSERYDMMRRKFGKSRFLGVLLTAPFETRDATPHR